MTTKKNKINDWAFQWKMNFNPEKKIIHPPFFFNNNAGICQRINDNLFNACLTVTGAIWGTSREKLHHELGLKPQISTMLQKILFCL